MMGGFAIVPDRSQQPAALFVELEDAIDWGLRTFGTDAFRIRWMAYVLLPPAEAHAQGARPT
jgi:hypothetical protein